MRSQWKEFVAVDEWKSRLVDVKGEPKMTLSGRVLDVKEEKVRANKRRDSMSGGLLAGSRHGFENSGFVGNVSGGSAAGPGDRSVRAPAPSNPYARKSGEERAGGGGKKGMTEEQRQRMEENRARAAKIRDEKRKAAAAAGGGGYN